MAKSRWIGAGFGAGGGGAGGVGATIFRNGNPRQGLELNIDEDPSWGFLGRLRNTENVQAHTSPHIRGAMDDGVTVSPTVRVRVTIPPVLAVGAASNLWFVHFLEGVAAVTQVRASFEWTIQTGADTGKGLRITLGGTYAPWQGVLGNDIEFGTVSGTPGQEPGIIHYSETGTGAHRLLVGRHDSYTISQFKALLDAYAEDGRAVTTEYLGGADGTETGMSVRWPPTSFTGGGGAHQRSPWVTVSLGSQTGSVRIWVVEGDTLLDIIAGVSSATFLIPGNSQIYTWGSEHIEKANFRDASSILADLANMGTGITSRGSSATDVPVAAVDEAAKTITLEYSPEEDSLVELQTVLEAADVTSTLLYETPGTEMPEDPPFVRPFRYAGGGVASAGDAAGAYGTIMDASDETLGVDLAIDGDSSWGFLSTLRRVDPIQPTANIAIRDTKFVELTLPRALAEGVAADEWSAVAVEGQYPRSPFGAEANFELQLGSNSGRGLRLRFTGTLASTIGTLGNAWSFAILNSGDAIGVDVDTSARSVALQLSGTLSNLGTYKSLIENYDTGNGVRFRASYYGGATGDEELDGQSVVWSSTFQYGTDARPRSDWVEVDHDAMEVTFNILADDTLAYIIANVAVATYDDADGTERTWGASNVAKETSSDDDDVEAFPDQYVGADFAGGEDPEDIAITLDEDDQEVTVRYAPVEDTLGEIFDAIDAAGYAATLIYGTSADGTPEDPPFARPFRSGIVVEREDDDDGDVTPGGGLAAADVKGLYPVSWAEAATPGAENVGLVQNIEGALFDHDVRHHDGHGKVVSYTDLTHADFRGWYHRAPDNLTSGQFFYVTAYNAFEIRRVHGEDGWTGVTGVFTYDPFATGEPWATAMIGGAATALVYQRQVSNEDLADDRATALAQVFAIADGSRIAYVSAFTARQDGYDEFFRHLYVARPRQIAEFWGFGQTESFADLPVDHVATAGAFFRYRFSQEKPNFSIGPDFGARAVDASDVLFIDLITGETALLDQHVVKLPAGIYDFNMAAAHRQTGDTSLGFWIYRVVSGADDIALFVGVAYSTIQQGPFAIVEAERYAQNIQVHRIFNFSETSYLTMLSGTFNHPTTGPDGSYALTVEKLG